MAFDELDIHTLIKRLEKVERTDLDERLGYIEKQLKFFSYACNSIDKSFKNGIKVSVDEQALNIVNPIKEVINTLKSEVLSIRELRKEIQNELKNESVTGTLKFMAKALHELTQHIHSIKEEGLKKDIHLAFTLDGYEMVKRTAPRTNFEAFKVNEEEAVRKLLDTLSDREKMVMIHRYGLFGEEKKTLRATGKVFDVTGERIREIQQKALRKCRHSSRKALVEDITHLELIKDIGSE